jgi:hypothetical protein
MMLDAIDRTITIILFDFFTFFLWIYNLSANEVKYIKSRQRAKELSIKLK